MDHIFIFMHQKADFSLKLKLSFPVVNLLNKYDYRPLYTPNLMSGKGAGRVEERVRRCKGR